MGKNLESFDKFGNTFFFILLDEIMYPIHTEYYAKIPKIIIFSKKSILNL